MAEPIKGTFNFWYLHPKHINKELCMQGMIKLPPVEAFRVRAMLINEDPTGTVKCRTTIIIIPYIIYYI